jgi:hypothetical protein
MATSKSKDAPSNCRKSQAGFRRLIPAVRHGWPSYLIGANWLLGACASWFMVGSEPVSGPLADQPLVTYRVPKCFGIAERKSIPGPVDQIYHLAKGPAEQLVLYEIDGSGKGARITSHWSDEKGDHFLTYVRRREAWEYIIPHDPGGSALRLVYGAGGYSVTFAGDQVRLASGIPTAVCDMVRTDQPAAPEGLAPVPAPPTAAAALPSSGVQGTGSTATTPAADTPVVPPVGGLCDSDVDCKGDRICVDHHCTSRPAVIGCEKDVDCPGEAVCVSSQCVVRTVGASSAQPPAKRLHEGGTKKRRQQ